MEEIAIIGIGCKLPGANDIEEFWRVLKNGENHVIEVPRNRWNLEAFYDPDPAAPGKTYVRRAGFVNNHESWDNKVYGVNDFEAGQMDPQQRFVLDCCFKAMEGAGVTRKEMYGSKTGVYIGVMNSDFKSLQSTNSDTMNNYTLTGTSTSIVAARVSFTFNLLGPALSIDTACSSSLLAIHLAAQALREGDCNMALAGGVNSMMSPGIFIQLSKARMASPTGYCQAFSAKADGYARGEGAGIVLLKRLKDAVRDNDPIWATIMTGSNQDGHTVTPMTAPSGSQQEALLRDVYDRYHVDPDELEYIEAHGTGTQAGDPVEANCLGSFLLSNHSKNSPKLIGSVKTNIGHLESAAGVAGVIKVLLMQKYSSIVPTLHFDTPNEKINFDKLKLTVATKLSKWPSYRQDGAKLSCVNSFSFGGTNCHAIIKSYCTPEVEDVLDASDETLRIICVSGTDETSLMLSIKHLCSHLPSTRYSFADIAFTSTVKRDHYPIRIAKVAKSTQNLIEQLDADAPVERMPIKALQKRKYITFVFCGMGSAWKGMCKEFMATNLTYFHKIMEVDHILYPLTGWSIYQRFQEESNPADPYFGPIASFTCQVALDAVWKSWGIKPDCIIGQSVGEVAAAHAAGALSLEDAVKVIYHRTYLQAAATGGSMLVVGNYDKSKVENIISEYHGKVVVAVHNSPRSCTLSGDTDVVKHVKAMLQDEARENKIAIFLHDLIVTSAFHSYHMNDCSKKLTEALTGLSGTSTDIKLYSTVSGKIASSTDFVEAEYWAKNVRESVLFQQALQDAMQPDCFNIFLEIGSKPVLSAHMKENFSVEEAKAFSSMKKDMETNCMMQSLAQLYVYGINPNWTAVTGELRSTADIPQYQFNSKSSLVISERANLFLMGGNNESSAHPFLRPIDDKSQSYKVVITPERIGSVYEHIVHDTILVPGAFHGEVGLAIAQHLAPGNVFQTCVSIKFKQPLVLSPGKTMELNVFTSTETDIKSNKKVTTYTILRENQKYAVGVISPIQRANKRIVNIDEISDRCNLHFTHTTIYENLKNMGFSYGRGLRVLGDAVGNGIECLVQMNVTEQIKSEWAGTFLHPAILDGMLQTPGVFQKKEKDDRAEILPIQIGQLLVRDTPEDNMVVYAKLVKRTKATIHYDILLLSEDGYVIAEARNFATQYLGIRSTDVSNLYDIHWRKRQSLQQPELQHEYVSDIFIVSRHENVKLNDFEVLKLHNIEQIDTQLNMKLKEIKKARAVIYISQANKIEETSRMFTSVIDECMVVREIIIQMLKNNLATPLIVVTENAWLLSYRDRINDTTASTPSAGALWGMLRTVGRELNGITMKLLDVSSNNYVPYKTLLLKAVENILPTNGGEVADGEFLIYKDCLHTLELLHITDTMENNHREVNMDNKCEVQLFSTEKTEFIDPFMRYVGSTTCSSSEKDVTMTTDILAIQNTRLYNTCADVVLSQHAYPVICLETVGSIKNHPGDIKYISCYPVQAAKTITVPKTCLIPFESLPNYRPGDIMKFVLLWSMCQTAASKTVTVLYNSKTMVLMEIASLILKKQMRVVQAVNTEDLRVIDSEIAISLISWSAVMLEKVIPFCSKIGTLISISTLIDTVTITMLHRRLPSVFLHLIRTENVYCPANLFSVMPIIRELIKEERSPLSVLFNELENHAVARCRSSVMFPRSVDITRLLSVTEVNFNDACSLPPVHVTVGSLFRKDAFYIVVGGLTGLGWECVRFLTANGARHIVCFNRRRPSTEKLEDMCRLETSDNCIVKSVQVNVTDLSSVKTAFDESKELFPAYDVKGVIFGAAVLDDAFLESMDRDKFVSAVAPKARGAWNLHLMTKDLAIDYFIMHSSVTGILGNQGQSNYGAGNAFEDSLAHLRRSMGLPGQSINWGPLNLGMLKDNISSDNVIEILKQQGYELLEIEEVHGCLLKCVIEDYPQVMASNFNLGKLRNTGNKTLVAKFHALLEGNSGLNNEKSDLEMDQTMTLDIATIKLLDREARMDIFHKYMIIVASKVFAIDESLVTQDSSIVDLGIDSMLAMTIIDQVYKDTKYRLPMVSLLGEKATIGNIVELIEKSFWIDLEPVENNVKDNEVPQIETTTEMTQANQEPNETRQDIEITTSFIENDIFSAETISNHTAFHFVKDLVFKVSPITDDDITQCAQCLTTRHSIAHTMFHESQTKSRMRKVIQNKECVIDVRVIDSSNDHSAYQQISIERFDLSEKAPVRIVYSLSPVVRIRIICHRIGFDSYSFGLFVEDFRSLVLARSANREPLPFKGVHIYYNVLEQCCTNLEKNASLFWTKEVPSVIPRMKLNVYSSVSPSSNIACKTVRLNLSSSVCMNIMNMISDLDSTLLKFFASIYQMLISFHTGHENVVVLTELNLRTSLPVRRYQVGNLTNHIPLFTSIVADESVLECLRRNDKKIDRCLNNVLFPFSSIEQMTVTEECRTNMKTHCIVHVDDTTSIRPLGTMYDTTFVVTRSTETEEIELQFQYRCALFTDEQAKNVLKQVQQMLDLATSDFTIKIQSIEAALDIKSNKDGYRRTNSNEYNAKLVHPALDIYPEISRQNNIKPQELPADSISYSEYYYYQRYLKDNPIGAHLMADIHIRKRPGDEKWWRSAAITLCGRYHITRTVFVKSAEHENYRYNIKKIEKNVEDVLDYRIVESSTDDAEFDRLARIPFDLSVSPARFIFSNSSTTRLRIVFHHVVVDFYSMSMILKDLRDIVMAIAYKIEPKASLSEQHQRAAVVVDKELKPIESQLQEFWKNEIAAGVPDITLRKNSTIISNAKNDKPVVVLTLPKDTCNKIIHLMTDLKTTVYKFFLSLYQTYLRFQTGHNRITVACHHDLRSHLPHAKNIYENMMNALPMTARFDDMEISMRNFVTANNKNINSCICHGLYPIDLIRELVVNVTEKERLTRHCVVEENMTSIESLVAVDDKKPNTTVQPSFGSIYETQLMIWLNKKHSYIRLHLEYSPDIYTEEQMKGHMNNLHKLLNLIIQNPEASLNSLMNELVPKPPVIVEQNEYSVAGRFFKETTQGYDHMVYAKLVIGDGQAELKWRSINYRKKMTKEPKYTKFLQLADITESFFATYRGFRTLVIITKKRRFIFKFVDVDKLPEFHDKLSSFLNNIISTKNNSMVNSIIS